MSAEGWIMKPSTTSWPLLTMLAGVLGPWSPRLFPQCRRVLRRPLREPSRLQEKEPVQVEDDPGRDRRPNLRLGRETSLPRLLPQGEEEVDRRRSAREVRIVPS